MSRPADDVSPIAPAHQASPSGAFPSIAAVVLNWNRRNDTLACLASLQNQTVRPTIVLVDNGSQDGTPHAVRQEFPAAHVIETGANLGYAGGNNVGIRYALAADADIIVIVNNDTLFESDSVEHLASVLAQPDVAAAAPKSVAADAPNLVHFAGGSISGLGEPYHCGLGCHDGPEYDVAHDTEWITGCALAVRRSAFEKIGMFDERFFLLFEDADWSLRARRAGMRLRYCPKARIRHAGSASFNGKASPAYQYYRTRNHLLWIEKHYPPHPRWKFIFHSVRSSLRRAERLSQNAPERKRLLRATRLGVVHFLGRRFGAGPL